MMISVLVQLEYDGRPTLETRRELHSNIFDAVMRQVNEVGISADDETFSLRSVQVGSRVQQYPSLGGAKKAGDGS